MQIEQTWDEVDAALRFAVSRVTAEEPLTERERADGNRYVVRVLAACAESALLTFDPARPAFLPMLESVRYLGASGPDIDYDVAIIEPGVPHVVTGRRGGASFVGIAVYGHAGDKGANAIVASVDVDEIAAPDGTFRFEIRHEAAARVIVRQYFHDRATQERGSWSIDRLDGPAPAAAPAPALPTVAGLAPRIANLAQSLRWNLQLNQLWTPELRATPNAFVRQSADDIVAAVPNPDVVYATSWFRLDDGEALVIDLRPPETRYWGLQLCDRWFQCFPDRRSNLNDRQVHLRPDGTVRIVVADGDPGVPDWLDTSGHRTGVLFFRWLHADPAELPTCRVVPAAEAPNG